MRCRISIRGWSRPSIRRSVRRSVGPSVPSYFKRELGVLGVYPALFHSLLRRKITRSEWLFVYSNSFIYYILARLYEDESVRRPLLQSGVSILSNPITNQEHEFLSLRNYVFRDQLREQVARTHPTTEDPQTFSKKKRIKGVTFTSEKMAQVFTIKL